MSKAHIAQSAIEIAIALLLIWACIHTDKLVAWEDRLCRRFTRWQHKLRRSIIAFGDIYFGEPYLINAEGEKEPLRILTAREQEESV